VARESPKAAAAFTEYCLLGPSRSLAKLAKVSERFGMPAVSVRHLEQWSSAHQWQEWAKEYDADLLAERERKYRDALIKMDAEHALIGRTAAIKAADLLRSRMDENDIGAYALVQLLKVATDLERLAREAATMRQEVTGKDGGPVVINTEWGTSKVRGDE
jgi:hypothetical protein